MKTIYTLLWGILLLGLPLTGCNDHEVTASESELLATIGKAESILAEAIEGNEEGNYAVGSKATLQTMVDWAYFILHHSSTDEAYSNAAVKVNGAIEHFYTDVVKAGIPHFDLGSSMNLGPVGDWAFDECFTVECCVKYTEFASGDQNILSCEGGSGGWMLRASGNVVQFYIRDASKGWNGCRTPALELDRWYHIAASYQKDGQIALYLDGKQVGTSACTSLSYVATTLLQAGTAPSYANRYMRGYIQHLSLWKDVRTESEIAADVQGKFTGTEEGLNAYWPLNLNLGTEITDVTGQHVATLTNVIWE